MAETSQEARPRGGKVRRQRAELLAVLWTNTHPVSSEAVTHRLAVVLSEATDGRRYVPSPSGVRTRLAELVTLGLAEVADEHGRTAAGNRCRRYRITDAGTQMYLRATTTPGNTLAALIEIAWEKHVAALEAPAHLRAEVATAVYGLRVMVQLVTPAGSQHVGWLDALPAEHAALVAALINGERP